MEWLLPVLLLIVGLVVGFAAAWLWMRARIEYERTRAVATMQADLAGRDARLQGRDQEISRLEGTIVEQKQRIDQATEQALESRQK